jgi:hypothetical protein
MLAKNRASTSRLSLVLLAAFEFPAVPEQTTHGNVEKLVLHQGGRDMPGSRVK